MLTSKYEFYRFDEDIQEEIKTLYSSDNWHAPLALVEDYAIIAICIASCYLFSWYLYPLAALIIGARQRGLSTILHDCAHGVGARTKWVRMLIATLFTAYPIFQQYFSYRKSHVTTHHPYLGNPNRDPDLSFYIEQKVYEPTTRRRYFLKNMLLPAVGLRTLAYLKYLIDYRLKRIRVGNEAGNSAQTEKKDGFGWERYTFVLFWATVTGVCAYFHVLLALLLFWVIPYLTSFQILGWYIELSEHTPFLEKESCDLYMARNRKSRGIEKFLTGIHNDHYHLDHHLNPAVPFWHLPKSNQIRLRDRNYAAVDARTGGLFTRGPNGAASAMSQILDYFCTEVQPERPERRGVAAE
jgi:fatty acid desaturase